MQLFSRLSTTFLSLKKGKWRRYVLAVVVLGVASLLARSETPMEQVERYVNGWDKAIIVDDEQYRRIRNGEDMTVQPVAELTTDVFTKMLSFEWYARLAAYLPKCRCSGEYQIVFCVGDQFGPNIGFAHNTHLKLLGRDLYLSDRSAVRLAALLQRERGSAHNKVPVAPR